MDLEYKIVQSTTPLFKSREKLEAVLAEEAKAGWQLVEKYDNYKLRLQRDISHREKDGERSFDAYRTQVGVHNAITYTIATVVTLAVVLGIFILVGAI